MVRGLASTLLILAALYLLSTRPVVHLDYKGKIPDSIYLKFYQGPITFLERIPVAGPLLDRYITWWQPPALSNAPLSYPSGP